MARAMQRSDERQPNRFLRSLRQRRGWTLEDVVRALDVQAAGSGTGPLGVDTNMLSRWERGVRRPSRRYAHLLCQVYGLPASADDLAVLGQRIPAHPPVPVAGSAPASLAGTGPDGHLALLQGAAQFDWERLLGLLSSPSQLREGDLDDLAALTRSYARQSESVPPAVLLGAVQSHLRVLERPLSHKPLTSPRLPGIVGEAAAVAGWLCFLRDDRGCALSHYRRAQGLAAEVGDESLLAHVLVVCGLLHSRIPRGLRGGDAVMPLALLERARAHADPSSATLMSWLLAHRAQEHAAQGAAGPALFDLERAERLLSRAGSGSHGLFGYWDGHRLTGLRGACALALGDRQDGIALLEESLAGIRPGPSQARCTVLTDLAAAYAQEAEIHQACRLLADCLTLAERAGLELAVQRVATVRQHLSRWRDSAAVRELDEQLRRVALGQQPSSPTLPTQAPTV